jgi:hypothetical protein
MVGHVLKKVDAERSPFLRDALDEEWALVQQGGPANEIFHDFIERERNSILKEYLLEETKVAPLDDGIGLESAGLHIGVRVIQPVDAVTEALSWWEKLLGRVEETAHRAQIKSKAEKRYHPVRG